MTHFGLCFKQLSQAAAKGDATEHTHRPALKTLLESLAPGIIATNEPKRIKYGAGRLVVTNYPPISFPDFEVSRIPRKT